MIKQWNIMIPELNGQQERKGYIYLPGDYNDKNTRYPVMYMLDGQNVFFDDHATFGKSWGMKEYMDANNKDLIIVAVESNSVGNCRLEEYSPLDFSIPQIGDIAGRGEVYMNWMVNTLKPYIDNHYRTIPDSAHTAICGSSMGGLMALYGVCKYNHIFQKAACLSPSLWINPGEVLHFLNNAKLSVQSRIYIDYGSEELANHPENPKVLYDVYDLLLGVGVEVSFKVIPGGIHNEASWGNQIPSFMNFLHL